MENFDEEWLRSAIAENPSFGVGEIGLDRLRNREISPAQRQAFAAQLRIAAEFSRPVVLHGAKCWGEVAKAAQAYAGHIPAFLFHGFSRSAGLIPQIAAINGFISIGPAILNDHAVNYRRLAAELPEDILLAETDRTEENAASVPPLSAIIQRLAELRSIPVDSLDAILERNADRFLGL